MNVVAVRARDRTPIEREPGWFLPALHPRPDAWELTPSGVRFDVAASCDLRFLSARATHAALPGFVQASHVEEAVYVHVEVRHKSLSDELIHAHSLERWRAAAFTRRDCLPSASRVTVVFRVEPRRHRAFKALAPPPPLTIEVAFRKLPARVVVRVFDEQVGE